VIFSSHLLGEVERICTHAAVMRAGRLLAHGPVSELIGSASSLEEAYLEMVGEASDSVAEQVGVET
jgi:ABC-2 type transport system ATP-binding protein